MTRLRFFALIREQLGTDQLTIELPPELETIADLTGWLAKRDPTFAQVFSAPHTIHAAINLRHARPSDSIRGAREIAFFPPMTGG